MFMKKIILSLVAMAFSGTVFAQTNSITAGNIPNVDGVGYTFQFNGTDVENCLSGGGGAYFGPTSQLWSIDGSGNLVVTVPNAAYESNAQAINFYTGNCSSVTIDLSTVADQKMEMAFTAPMAGQVVVIYYTGAASNYNNNPIAYNFTTGANVLSSTLDLTGSGMSDNALTYVGLLFRGPAGWNDNSFNGAVSIDYIKIGTDVVTTATTASVDNSLISVYPNPAKDQINIDLSSMNNASDASVKIMNSNGMLVYEGNASNSNEIINTSSLNKGIYLVQVSAGNKISNKKLVIE